MSRVALVLASLLVGATFGYRVASIGDETVTVILPAAVTCPPPDTVYVFPEVTITGKYQAERPAKKIEINRPYTPEDI